MSHDVLIHVADDVNRLLISEPDVIEDNLVDEPRPSQRVSNSVGMPVGDQDLPSIQLIRFCFPVNHAEALRDLAFIIHLLVVLYQVARAIIFALNLV